LLDLTIETQAAIKISAERTIVPVSGGTFVAPSAIEADATAASRI